MDNGNSLFQEYNLVFTGRARILVIEDQAPILEILQEFLEIMGYIPLGACDLESARDMASQNASSIRIILCDLFLGSQNGPDIVRELMEWVPDAVVVFMSGFASIPPSDGKTEGPAMFLQKPFSFDSLKTAIEKALSLPACGNT